MTTSDDSYRPREREPDGGLEPLTVNGRADISREVLYRLTEDRERLAHDLNDNFVRQMFAISLDLHGALTRIEHDPGDPDAAVKIRHAIAGLDHAIHDLRDVVIGDRFGAPAAATARRR